MQMSLTVACGLGHSSQPPSATERPSRCLTRQVCSSPYALARVEFLLEAFNSLPGERVDGEGPHPLGLCKSPLGVGLL